MTESQDHTKPSDATSQADHDDAGAAHDADRPPTDGEAAAAPAEVSESVKASHRAANERGAAVKGEGQISGS